MHITASAFINDDEPGLHQDYDRFLEKLAPHGATSQYRRSASRIDGRTRLFPLIPRGSFT